MRGETGRVVLLLVVSGMLSMWGWLWWKCSRDSSIYYLARHGATEWIVFPKPPDTQGRPEAELFAEFRRRFALEQPPTQATLTMRTFQRGVVTLNGTRLPEQGQTNQNWKRPQVFDVTKQLRQGSNSLSVTVFNSFGPPALWAELRGENLMAHSDESWEVSYAGSVWCPARLACKPMAAGAGSPVQGGERISDAWRVRWPTITFFAILSALLVAGWSRRSGSAAAQSGSGVLRWIEDPAALVLAGAIVLWILLFAHNMGVLPPTVGFDAVAHIEYVNYILEHKALPLASEGAVTYHPPLYYLLAAGLLGVLSLSTGDAGGLAALQVFSLAIGIANLLLVFGGLRLIFPNQARTQVVGLALAAFLPMHLYITHYFTNETLTGMLVTATIFACLRLVRMPQVSTAACAVLGLCLGAALLTKFTAVLVAPFVIGAAANKIWRQRSANAGAWLRTMGVLVAVCLAICGWHYIRVWTHFGKPLVGVWDPVSGHRWWQDEGYRTASYFLRFGESLDRPTFSGFNGFGDGVYSTLWGDALCGGMTAVDFRPPWNYDLMAVGYWLALLPTLAMLTGAVWALWHFLRKPTADWMVLNGLAFAFALAFVFMALKVPYYGQVKASYGLLTLLPLCAYGAAGWDALTRRGRVSGWILSGVLGLWAMNSYASFWIHGRSAQAQISQGMVLLERRRNAEAAERFAAAMRADPRNVQARSFLVQTLMALGRLDDAWQLAQQSLKENSHEAVCHLDLAAVLESRGQWESAVEHTRRALHLAPDHSRAHVQLASRLARLQRLDETVRACREGLRVTPADPELHLLLGSAWAAQDMANGGKGDASWPLQSAADKEARAIEGMRHLRIASQAAPDSPIVLNNVAWIMATHPNARLRDAPEAVRLAERACSSTKYQTAVFVGTLAAAYAEAGRYAEAVTTAQKARVLADASGQAEVAALNAKLAALFRDGKAYRQSTSTGGGSQRLE